MTQSRKWYVVWNGHRPGVYDTWAECQHQTKGYPNAQFRAYPSKDLAYEAFEQGYRRASDIPLSSAASPNATDHTNFVHLSLSVDAACSGNPGLMEYRGVLTWSKAELFRIGPFAQGTNNIGEFLALVHGMALLTRMENPLPIYSDSVTAMSWVRQKKCKTLLLQTDQNAQIFELIRRAEQWLKTNNYAAPLLKWNTKQWGEIPADFGRK